MSKKADLSKYGNMAVLDVLMRVLHSVIIQCHLLLISLTSLIVIIAALAFFPVLVSL